MSSSKEKKNIQSTLARYQTVERNNAHWNEKLDKLTNVTQNLENNLNGIQKKMVEYENKLN